ncbi:hypothetical protein ZHAS_00022268 [Anopheles sinensis]|uniref:Uncharacterized protein n=1 Tax=Anopheles sinensis TaxID=74873 RepID=A0A084WUW9_ANOSI|nr:hypothetical protein ZHAS_00022268 [Anopheles sinensis]
MSGVLRVGATIGRHWERFIGRVMRFNGVKSWKEGLLSTSSHHGTAWGDGNGWIDANDRSIRHRYRASNGEMEV